MQTRSESRTNATASRSKSRGYAAVFLMLALLTAAEVFVATAASLPKVPFLVAMSLVKAMLVILYFMHLRSDSRWFGVIFFAPFLLVVPLLLVLPR